MLNAEARPNQADFSNLLRQWQGGDREAYDQLFSLAYEEIKRISHLRLRSERANHSFQTTDLAHEVFLKMVKYQGVQWKDREHFLNTAARAMFQILIDHARVKERKVHGQPMVPMPLAEECGMGAQPAGEFLLDLPSSEKLLDLWRAIEKLKKLNSRWGLVAVLKLNFGMNSEEIAEELGIHNSKVKHIWQFCKQFLSKELNKN